MISLITFHVLSQALTFYWNSWPFTSEQKGRVSIWEVASGYPTGFTTKDLAEEGGNKRNYFLLAGKLNYTTARTRQIEAGGILQVWPSSSSARTLHSGAAVSSPPEWSWEETALSHWYCKWLKDVWLQISFRKWMMASHSGAVLSSQHFRDRGRWICESLTNLIYLVSSRTTRAVYRPCFKRKRANKTESEPGNTTKIHQYCASYRTPLWGSILRKSCWACQGRM